MEQTNENIKHHLERIEAYVAIGAKQVLSISECALYLGIEKTTLYNKCERREIPHYKVGRAIRFKKSEIDEYLVDGERIRTVSDDRRFAEQFVAKARKRV